MVINKVLGDGEEGRYYGRERRGQKSKIPRSRLNGKGQIQG